MKYILSVLEEYVQEIEEKTEQACNNINYYQRQIEKLNKENTIRNLQIYEITNKINHIKKTLY